MPSKILAYHAPRQQQFIDERIHSRARLTGAPPLPGLAGHGFFDVERKSHGAILREPQA